MDNLLIAGLWLDGSVWAEVCDLLVGFGHRPVPLTLPGQGTGECSATLEDQVAAVVEAVDAAEGRPDRVAKVVLIGGFPAAHGEPYADFLEPTDGFVGFPGWERFEGPDAADLDDEARRRFVAAAIPVPEAVTKGVVRLRDEHRFEVPVVVVCPEFSPADARGWIDAGEVPELARTRHVELIDIDSGHWPMLTKPADLARILAHAADA